MELGIFWGKPLFLLLGRYTVKEWKSGCWREVVNYESDLNGKTLKFYVITIFRLLIVYQKVS